MAFIPFSNVNFQFTDASGDALASGTLTFQLSGTTTATNVFSDSAGVVLGTSITLNSSGRAPTPYFRDTAIDYKYILKNAAGTTVDTFDEIKSGFSGLLATNPITAGTANAPAITLGDGVTNDVDTGIYHSADNEWSVSTGGTRRNRTGSFGFDITVAGSAGSPSLFFDGDTNSGWYQTAADQWGFAVSGSAMLNLLSTGLTFAVANPALLGGDTNGIFTLSSGATTILGSNIVMYGDTHSTKAGDIEFKNDNTVRMTYDLSATKWTATGLFTVTGALKSDTSLELATGATVTGVADEDNMASNSNTLLSTQQSIKAYADSVGAKMVFIANATASGDSSIDFVTSIDSTYDSYEIHLLNIVPANDNVILYLRTSTDASTFDAGASDYSWGFIHNSAISTVAGSGDISSTHIPIAGSGGGVGSDTNELGVSGKLTLVRPSEATYTQVVFVGMHNQFTPFHTPIVLGGARNSAADVNGIRFIFSAGDVESGLFTLYGIKRS